MIRVRYKGLAPGLHGKAEHRGHRTTIFLVPGLTSAQRKAALRRLRQEARRECGPRLPVPQLAIALAADRLRVALRGTAAVIRLHPAGSILPTAAIGCLMVLFVLASVSVRIIHRPETTGPSGVPVVSGSGAGASGPGVMSRVPGPGPADPGGPGATGSSASGASGTAGKLSQTLVALSSSSSAGGTGHGSGSGSGRNGGSGPVSPAPGVPVGAAGAGGVSVSASAGPSPSQSPGGSSGGGGISVCVNIGPFADCVGL